MNDKHEDPYFGKFVNLHRNLNVKKKPNILVSPLDWGIGHATRCVPIINELIEQNTNVIIGADNRPLAFLKQEFPSLQFVQFPGYKFSYPGKGSMALKMARQAPAILKGIKEEKKLLKKLIRKLNIDAVISDNRYGLSSDTIPSIFITHQIMIKVPAHLKFLETKLYNKNIAYISKFNECWIPDFENEINLSGDLSHKKSLPPKSYYIGPLSRFAHKQLSSTKTENSNKFKYDLLVMLSGPEPQRTILEEKIINELLKTDLKSIVVCGKPEKFEDRIIEDKIIIYSHLDSKSLEKIIKESRIVISRPGYSTVMDLVALSKKAIFIPTPGQTEQEYLAEHYFKNKLFYKMKQKEFNLTKAMTEATSFSGIKLEFDQTKLKKRIRRLLDSI